MYYYYILLLFFACMTSNIEGSRKLVTKVHCTGIVHLPTLVVEMEWCVFVQSKHKEVAGMNRSSYTHTRHKQNESKYIVVSCL
jgi:arginine/lysine/ornithine decarboxylase